MAVSFDAVMLEVYRAHSFEAFQRMKTAAQAAAIYATMRRLDLEDVARRERDGTQHQA